MRMRMITVSNRQLSSTAPLLSISGNLLQVLSQLNSQAFEKLATNTFSEYSTWYIVEQLLIAIFCESRQEQKRKTMHTFPVIPYSLGNDDFQTPHFQGKEMPVCDIFVHQRAREVFKEFLDTIYATNALLLVSCRLESREVEVYQAYPLHYVKTVS